MAQNFDVSVLVQQMAALQATIENMRTVHQRQVQNLEEQIRQVQHVEVIPGNQRVTIEPRITNENQSLTLAISEKNPNAKLMRWKNIIEDFGAKLVYKPGHLNVVADALSRQQINSSTISTVHSAASSPTNTIDTVRQPLNAYATQVELIPNKDINDTITYTVFTNKIRHQIRFYEWGKSD
ncbi:Retrovirus-related Pol polyprotein from transposon gypsy [Eumeta japonica]|uniref:Retrovirus-related Pol polyprotein from transposon gypsy n=1 Tax=Eumeta variegata TaxID=151549 RepID=A0A4C1SFI4_EUMVA|nr:Retrovirus-related Pol polyprotein from transposon gypsy [Eumeta japonica]